MRYVLDTTALFNAKDFPIDFEISVPQGVLDELINWGMSERVRMLVGVRIHVESPTRNAIDRVEKAAERTGDIDRLSPTDVQVLALALDLQTPLISDDYSIQNVASSLGIECLPMETRGIKKIYFWKYACRGCGKEFDRRLSECDVCGKELVPRKYKAEELGHQKM
ncbi:MAG: nucleic acid-binding protein [Thermoplasmata archaeon]